MYRSIHSKNFRWGLAINTFPKTAKEVSKAYWTGIRWWKHDYGLMTIAIVFCTFRFMLTFPTRRNVGICKG